VNGWFGLLVAILATWRVSHLVAREDGPFDVVLMLRRRAGEGPVGRLMDCPYCLSLWVAAPIAAWMAPGWLEGVLIWLAISGGASLAERLAEAASARAEPPVIALPPVAGDAGPREAGPREAGSGERGTEWP
jgi:hypothetical protein